MSERNPNRRLRDQAVSDGDLSEEVKECRRNGYILTGKFLGQGAYAKVYLGQALPEKIQNNLKLKRVCNQDKGVKVAIKIISTSSAPEVYITKFLPREVSTMNKCYRHANVIQLYDLFATSKRIYLILEYAECGDLLTFVNHCYSKRSGGEPLTEDRARFMFQDILAGVNFIHARGVAHRDLKCENILLARNRQAKLSDFGFAIEPRQSRELLKTHCGSYAYAAPEILKQQRYDGKLADIWSLGVILFAMVNGGLPFKESDAKAVLGAMKKPVYFKSSLTSDCKDLIRGLLKIRPQRRLTVNEIISHAWMKKCQPYADADHQAGGDEDRDLTTDIPLIRGRIKDWNGQFLSPESVLKYLRERIGLRAMLYKHPERPLAHDEYLDEESNEHHPTLTSVQLSPQLVKESVPATPVFPPHLLKTRKTPLPRPQPPIEMLQKTGNSSRQKILAKAYMKPFNNENEKPGQIHKVPLPRVIEGISQTDQTDFDTTQENNESTVENDYCNEREADRNTDTPAIVSMNPGGRLSSVSRSESKTKRMKRGRRTADNSSHNRRSTTPNVVNLHIPTNRPTMNRTIGRKNELLQRISLYNAHAHRKFRCGATSVPPESHTPRPATRCGKKSPQKVSAQRQRTSSSLKEINKMKSSNSGADNSEKRVETGNDVIKKASNSPPKKMLMTIPEKEESSVTPKTLNECCSVSPDQSTDVNSFQSQTPDAHDPAVHRNRAVCPRNSPFYHDHYHKAHVPGCAMAAWVGQHCSERSYPDSFPVNTAQFLGQKNIYYRSMADKYSPNPPMMMADPKPHEHGKLLYKRAQTGKNMLESIAHSMKMTPGLTHRRPQAPTPRSNRDISRIPAPPSPPPVLRLTHNKGSKMR